MSAQTIFYACVGLRKVALLLMSHQLPTTGICEVGRERKPCLQRLLGRVEGAGKVACHDAIRAEAYTGMSALPSR